MTNTLENPSKWFNGQNASKRSPAATTVTAAKSSGGYFKTSDGEIFLLALPLDFREQVEKDIGEILTESEKETRMAAEAVRLAPQLIAEVKTNKYEHDDKYYLPGIEETYEKAKKSKALDAYEFREFIRKYNMYRIPRIDRGWLYDRYSSEDRKKEVGELWPEYTYPKWYLSTEGNHDWIGRAFYFDEDKVELHYYDTSGAHKIMNLLDMRPIDERDKIRVLEMTFEVNYNIFSGMDSWKQEAAIIKKYKDINGGRARIPYLAYSDDEFPEVRKFLDIEADKNHIRGWGGLEELKKANQSRLSVDSVLKTTFIAPLMAQDFADDYKNILKKVKDDEDAMINAKPSDCPKIPMLREDIQFFPHQAKALATADKSNKIVFDIDMGGGKTLTMLADCLNQLNKGNIRRPAIVMPNGTIPQQKDEIEFFTNGQVNVFCINTEVMNRTYGGDLDKMAEVINALPINSILLVSYDWLKLGYEKRDMGIKDKNGAVVMQKDFVRSRWLIDKCKVDMVSVDESHYIKNGGSATSQAVICLSRAKVRRIATGTLIPNNPQDIVAQMSFVDPAVFGTWDNFVQTYAAETHRGTVISWEKDALKKIRQKLISNGAISIRRSHWMHLLPEREEVIHKVSLTSNQQKVYELVINDIIAEIQKDSKMAELWKKYQDEDDEAGAEEEFGMLLAKLAKMDAFLCAPPTYSKFLKHLPEEDQVSPKVACIDKILKKHFDDPHNGKVIVFAQNRASCEHIIQHSKFQKGMLYYDASVKGNIDKFKNDPNVTTLVAVDDSLKEGHNLQVGNCTINADVHWAPGPMEQRAGRVFRPKQKRKCYIHTIVTDNTAEVTKYARLVSKHHVARKINSDFDDNVNLKIIKMNLGNMQNFRDYTLLQPYVDRVQQIQKDELEESKVVRKTYGDSMIASLTPKLISGSKQVITPYVTGSKTLYPVTVVSYTTDGKTWWLVEDEQSISMMEDRDARKLGFKWWKEGWWFMEAKPKAEEDAWVEEAKKSNYDVKFVKGKGESEKEKKKGSKTKDGEETPPPPPDKIVELYLVDFDGHVTLGVPKDDDDAAELKKYGFVWKHQYYWRLLKSKADAANVLEYVENNLDLEIKGKADLIKTIVNHKVMPGAPPTINVKRVKEGKPDRKVELHFTLIDGHPYLTVPVTEDNDALRKLKKIRFFLEPAHYWKKMASKNNVDATLKQLKDADYRISNWNDFIKGCKKAGVTVSYDLSVEEE